MPSPTGGMLPPISNSKKGAGVDVTQILGETLAKLIGERRGGAHPMISSLLDGSGGKVSLDEFTDAVIPLGLAPAEVSLIFGHFDKYSTGFIEFEALHKELTARVAERTAGRRGGSGRNVASHQLEKESPFKPGGAGLKPVSRPSKGSSGTPEESQHGLSKFRSPARLQAPSWDPVKGKVDPDRFKRAPLWRDEALDASGGSKSLMRALSSTGSLIRPSVVAAEQLSKQRESHKELQQRQASSASSSTTATFKPKLVRLSHDELATLKTGEADEYISKIHDEELVAQQVVASQGHALNPHMPSSCPECMFATPSLLSVLPSLRCVLPIRRVTSSPPSQLNAAVNKMKERISAAERAGTNPLLTKDISKVLMTQQRIIEGRGNFLLSKANEIRAANATLREAISKLRLERRLHNEFRTSLKERLMDLTKQVPALVDRVNVLLFEGEKVQMKVVQTHQDAMLQKAQVEDLLQDSTEAVAQAEEMISKFQESAYENEQQHAQMQFNLAKQRRIEEEMGKSRLGYLKWKTGWWVREFERLKKATGLELDFSAVVRGEPLDTAPIDAMMTRYSTQSLDCDSLEHFLDTLGKQVAELELELIRLQEARHHRDEVSAHATAMSGGDPSGSTLSDAVAKKLTNEIEAKCESQEALLREAFRPTKALLRLLAPGADFVTRVEQAEAQRQGKFAGEESTPRVAAVGASLAEEEEDREATANQSASTKAAGGMQKWSEVPSVGLLRAADELEASHNAHRVKLLDEALKSAEHEILGIHDATKRFKLMIEQLLHPNPSTAGNLPRVLQTWGAVGYPEVLNVHAEFKRLANESEKRQREEAMREEAALEESRNARRSPHAVRATAGQMATTLALPAAGGEAADPSANLSGSLSMPSLSSPTEV